MPYASVRGLRLYFEDHGSGPCVMVAHGMLGSVATATVTNSAKLAANGLRVIAYDARGHGNSEHTTRNQDYSWSALAEDLHQLMNALGVERAAICGTSMGAGVALMLALTKPSTVERLILRSPPPFGDDLVPARRRMGSLATMCRYLGVPLTARLIGSLTRNREQAPTIAAQRRAAIVPAIRGLLFDGPPLPVERLPEIHVPVLVLGHPHDPMHPLRSAQLIESSIVGALLHVSPSAQHWTKNPAAFCELVASFVKTDSSVSERQHRNA